MKNLKRIAVVAMFGMMSFGGYSTYECILTTDAEHLMMENVEALTQGESGGGYKNGRAQYCAIPEGKQGCVNAPLRNCGLNVFCIR